MKAWAVSWALKCGASSHSPAPTQVWQAALLTEAVFMSQPSLSSPSEKRGKPRDASRLSSALTCCSCVVK